MAEGLKKATREAYGDALRHCPAVMLLPDADLDALRRLEADTGISCADASFASPEVLEAVRAGRTQGVPELDSEQLRRALGSLPSLSFSDVVQALGLLRGATNRKAAWYYWSARANMGLGNRIAALNDARTAVNMAPDEPAFRELLAQLNAGSRAYGQRGTQGGFGSYLCANPCLTLCLANMLCNCCCLGGRGGFYYC